MREWLEQLFSKKKPATKAAEIQEVLNDTKGLTGEAVKKMYSNQAALEPMLERAQELELQGGRFRGKSSLLKDGDLPKYDATLNKLSDEQLQQLALNYRQGKFNPETAVPLQSALRNETRGVDPYVELEGVVNAEKLDMNALRSAQERLRETTGREINTGINKDAILGELQAKNPKAAKEIEELLGDRKYVLPQDLERIKGIKIGELPETAREMQLLGKGYGEGKWSGILEHKRQQVKRAPEIGDTGQYGREADSIIQGNKDLLMDNLKGRMGDRLPKASNESLIDSWLTNPTEFEKTGNILPERQFSFNRPVIDKLLKDKGLSAKSGEHFGDVLADIAKERNAPDLNGVLDYAKQNPHYFRSKIKQIHPTSDLNRSQLDKILGDVHSSAKGLPTEDIKMWSRLEPGSLANAPESFLNAMDENPKLLEQMAGKPIAKISPEDWESASSGSGSRYSDAKSEMSPEIRLKTKSEAAANRAANPGKYAENVEYPVENLFRPPAKGLGAEAPSANPNWSPYSYKPGPSLTSEMDASRLGQRYDAGSMPKGNAVPYNKRFPELNNGKAVEMTELGAGARATKAARPLAEVAPAVGGLAKFGSQALKAGSKVLGAAGTVDLAKQGMALSRHNYNEIKDKGLVEGTGGAIKSTLGAGWNTIADIASMASAPARWITSNTVGKLIGMDAIDPGAVKQYLPDNPLDKQRFKSGGLGDDVGNYFKEAANDAAFFLPWTNMAGYQPFEETGAEGYNQQQQQQAEPASKALVGPIQTYPVPIPGTLSPEKPITNGLMPIQQGQQQASGVMPAQAQVQQQAQSQSNAMPMQQGSAMLGTSGDMPTGMPSTGNKESPMYSLLAPAQNGGGKATTSKFVF